MEQRIIFVGYTSHFHSEIKYNKNSWKSDFMKEIVTLLLTGILWEEKKITY